MLMLAYQYVNRNVARMSHGRFQSFHHHVLVILMTCMTGGDCAANIYAPNCKSTAGEHSSTFTTMCGFA